MEFLNFAHSYHTFSDSCCRRYSGHRRRRDKTLAIASYSFLVPLYETVAFVCRITGTGTLIRKESQGNAREASRKPETRTGLDVLANSDGQNFHKSQACDCNDVCNCSNNNYVKLLISSFETQRGTLGLCIARLATSGNSFLPLTLLSPLPMWQRSQ